MAVSFIDLNFESAATGPIFTAKIRGPCLMNQTRTPQNMLSNYLVPNNLHFPIGC